ncbi:hypothetical protein PGTUg99_017306 [Puccinia graminis f. sp. tritici]|uniref:Hydrophobin n=1 Tax=Puccinia graminis f. sp. tritici TaxID=56615 RepID=A0A5B0Q1X1_PUCGR|nr:hypothetical protein PGTUg99_017306 [Puccinia graminis f. sp. tritici]
MQLSTLAIFAVAYGTVAVDALTPFTCNDWITHRYIGQCGHQSGSNYILRDAESWPGDEPLQFTRCRDTSYCCGQDMALGRGITKQELDDNCTDMT